MNQGEALIRTLRHECAALVQTVDRDTLLGSVVRGDARRDDYVRFLRSTYQYVRWSGRLLAATSAGLSRNPCWGGLAPLVAAKAEEESPHDGWALEDLRALGDPVERLEDAPCPSAIQAYVHWSLSSARDGSPAFLGCAYALEFMSMRRSKQAADNLRAVGAIPHIQRAVSFLAGHGDADEHHLAALEQALAGVDDPAGAAEIALSVAVLRTLYPRFFRAEGSGA